MKFGKIDIQRCEVCDCRGVNIIKVWWYWFVWIWDFQVNWWSAWMWSEITQFDGSWIIFCLWSECVEVSDEWNVLTCNKVCRSCAFNLLNLMLQILVGAILVLKMALVLAIFSISALKFENWQQQNGLQTVSFCDFQWIQCYEMIMIFPYLVVPGNIYQFFYF